MLILSVFQDIGPTYFTIVMAMDNIHNNNKKILHYAWINFPLGYTQVATFAVYAYFVAQLFAEQFFEIKSKTKADNSTLTNGYVHQYSTYINSSDLTQYWAHFPNIYVPIYSILEFISYMGWIKVAETLLNPWGEDDEVLSLIHI